MFTPPDWRDPGNYPRPDARFSNTQFAWEFLRRNPAYCTDWAKYVETLRMIAAAVEEDAELASCIEAMAGTDADWRAWCAGRSRDATDSIMCRVYDAPGYLVQARGRGRVPLALHFGEPWGLRSILDPAHDAPMLLNFNAASACAEITSHGLSRLEAEAPGDGPPSLYGRHLCLQVDLSLPLAVIEADVVRTIRLARAYRAKRGDFVPITNRGRPEKYVEYLRILDALSAGASWHDIGEYLVPHESNERPDRPRDKRLQAAAKQAQRLRDDGYRVLPLLHDPTLPKIGGAI